MLQGRRFDRETLEVKHKKKHQRYSEMSVVEAEEFLTVFI
jgi:excinuclease UvrABC ATPase subunit